LTRAAAARHLGLSSSSATEIAAQLRDVRLIAERSAPIAGRGRPTTVLQAHPDGPLAVVVDIRHHDWRLALAALDGTVDIVHVERHSGRAPRPVLGELRSATRDLLRRYAHRLRIVSVAIAGTVQHQRVVQSAALGWHDVDLDVMVRGTALPIVVGNDATLAGVAEARALAPSPSSVVLYLTIEVGVGGIVIAQRVPMVGASGAAGEFGHMPFGTPGVPCACGASGCWDNDVDGRGMARRLGRRRPADPRSYARRVIARADSDPRAHAVVEECALSFGAGTAALVNALDPAVVILGGVGASLLSAATATFRQAYVGGLMQYRRAAPPEVRASRHVDDAALYGAAEVAFDAILQPESLAQWGMLQLNESGLPLTVAGAQRAASLNPQ
jgi:predicted NBD/HSP70 family sugar kinase